MNGILRKSDVVGRNTDELNATLARVGGDEFTLLLTDIQHAEDAAKVATRILKVLLQPFTVDNHEVFISASIGIAVCPADGEDRDTLLKNADSALNHAKNQGKNNFQFYEQSMNTAALKKLTLESSLRRALERKEFFLFYQPQFDCRTGAMIGMEALIRWKHPDMGMVSPGDFIPLAEETGLIVQIGEWVLATACMQVKAWREQGLPTVRMSVNLSGKQFEHPDLVPVIARILDEFGLGPDDIVPEITESIIMKNTEKSIATMDELHATGLRFMIDDFGTGYSSLSYLKRFPLYAIKIDGSFVRDITTNSDDAAIANAIIGLAHNLKLRVIAECVETKEQLAFLVEHGCDEIQGYLFSRPCPPEEVGEMLARERDGKGIGLPHRVTATGGVDA
jgi:EAL domain-containing protein (putative c-di-GMP-specific phosphodiesterase class I)